MISQSLAIIGSQDHSPVAVIATDPVTPVQKKLVAVLSLRPT